jgi:hypothetical protein
MALWSDLKIKLIATGDETGTWGETTNANFNNVIEQAITGSATVTFADANVVLPLIDSTELQDARALRLFLSGTTTLPRNLTVPNIQKFYIIDNDLPNNITVKNPTGAETFTVPAGTSSLVFSKGTGVVNAMSYFTGALTSFLAVITGGSIDDTPIGADTASTGAFTTLESTSLETTSITGLTTPLSVGQGGTGQTTTSLAINALVPSQTGNSGKALVTNGTSVSWGAAFVSGMIMMWSGTIATIPTGWVLCDGSNGTPDLRNRFIVGAYSDTTGVAYTTITGANTQTGGSKDAIVVSHTHTATSTVTDPGHTHVVPLMSTNAPSNGSGNLTGANQTPTSYPVTSNSRVTGITVATSNSTEGSSGTNANLVPYFALAFIMKI